MITPEIQQYVQQQIAEAEKNRRYSTTNAAYHVHGGVDSPKIKYSDLLGAPSAVGVPNSGTNNWYVYTASGTQTIAHGLGATPSYVRIRMDTALNGSNYGGSIGTWSAKGMNCSYASAQGSDSPFGGTTTSYVIYWLSADTPPVTATASLTVDATNLYLAWTSGTGSENLYFLWEAYS